MNSIRITHYAFAVLALSPLAGLFTSALAPSEAHASLEIKKSWYMGRGRSNMEIGNYKAAIEAFEKVTEEDPDNSEAMRSLGIAYEHQGFKDKAVALYDRYLEKNPQDADIAFRQAEALEWSRYSYRKDDAKKYYKQGLQARPGDTGRRLKYARLLASNQGSNGEAIEQYRSVLKSQPRNGEAHRGLAKAYAWNGQNDKAVYHSQLAKQFGTSSADLKRVDRDLHKGRESTAGGQFLFLTQPGAGYDLNGFQLSANGKTEMGAFVTMNAQAGYENFWQAGNESAMGGFFHLGAQYRLDEQQSLYLKVGYHSIAPLSGTTPTNTRTSTQTTTASAAGLQNFLLKAEYQLQGDDGFKFTPGFERSIRRDSFLSLVGSQKVGTGLGAARSNLFHADSAWNKGTFEYGLNPYVGWVSAMSITPNIMMGVDGVARVHLLQEGDLKLTLGDLTQVVHYGEDQSALSGAAAGGYFSPQFFLNQYPHLRALLHFSDSQELDLTAGPTIQYVKDTSLNGQWQIGANIAAGFSSQFAERLNWRVGASYAQVANKFNQVQIDNSVGYTF